MNPRRSSYVDRPTGKTRLVCTISLMADDASARSDGSDEAVPRPQLPEWGKKFSGGGAGMWGAPSEAIVDKRGRSWLRRGQSSLIGNLG